MSTDAPPPRTNDHLANERTYLAWVRTSVALIGLGFVLARFSLYLHEIMARLDPAAPQRVGLSMPLGEILMGIGAMLTLMAALRYRTVGRAIQAGTFVPDDRMVLGLTLLIVLLGGAAIGLMVYHRG